MSSGARRTPWVAVEASVGSSRKHADLPNDTARWGWVVVLGLAKLLRPAGQFASRQHWRQVVGRFARYLDDYIRVGLLEEAPNLCDDCRSTRHYGDVRPGTLIFHDWHVHQRDAAIRQMALSLGVQERETYGAQRTRAWRLRSAVFERDAYICRYCGLGPASRDVLVADHIIPVQRPDSTDDMDNLVTACRACNYRKGSQTPEEAGMSLLPVPGVGDLSRDPSRDASRDSSPLPRDDNSSRALSRVNGLGRSVEGGAGGDPLPAVEVWLARQRAAVVPGSTTHRDLARLVDQHGSEAVISAMGSLPTPLHDAAQYVYGARKLLNPIPGAPRRQPPKGAAHSQEEIDRVTALARGE